MTQNQTASLGTAQGLRSAEKSTHSQPRNGSGPRTFDALLELPRVMLEVSKLSVSWPMLLQAAPNGEPHPVMVLPGFMGGDESTLLLRRFLTRLGYKALPWLQGSNTGNPSQLEAAMVRFYRLQHAFDTRISLVGQSLGGVYARRIAREFPDAVRCVITLGSPYRVNSSGQTNPLVEMMFERMSGLSVEQMRALIPTHQGEHEHLPMPATSIYSKQDGVVSWEACVEAETDLSENIRVLASHSGMAMNADSKSRGQDGVAGWPIEEIWSVSLPGRRQRRQLKIAAL